MIVHKLKQSLSPPKSWNVMIMFETGQLFLRIGRTQLWSVTRQMPQERLERHILLSTPTGKWPRGRQRTKWRDYNSDLAWSRICVESAEMSEVAENHEVFQILLGLLPRDPPQQKAGVKRNKQMNLLFLFIKKYPTDGKMY